MKWRAIISTLYEGGFRAMELLKMKISSLNFTKNGVRVTVNGKTEERKVMLVNSEHYLSDWLNHHHSKDKEAWLWPSQTGKTHIDDQRLNVRLKRLAKKAGITKKLYAHLFRHSRATALASALTEQELKKYFGWAGDSRIASVYVHMNDQTLEDKILEMHGRKKRPQQKLDDGPLETIQCQRCGFSNPAGNDYCSKCRRALSLKGLLDASDLDNDVQVFLKSMAFFIKEKPEKLKPFNDLMKKYKEQIKAMLDGKKAERNEERPPSPTK